MNKIPKHELILAAHMVAGFSHESGETSLDHLSDLCAVDDVLLRSWAMERGYLVSFRPSPSAPTLNPC